MPWAATTLAVSVWELPGQLAGIFHAIVLPILLLAAAGYVIQRRMGLDMPTLTRLNFYFVMPALIYSSVVTARTSARQAGMATLFALLALGAMAALTWLAARLKGVPAGQRNALLMTTMFHNSGNYALPLQKLAFGSTHMGDSAVGLQVFYMLTQNLTNFTIGILLASGGRGDRSWRAHLRQIAKFPPLYALAAALLTVAVGRWLGGEGASRAAGALAPFWTSIKLVRSAFLAVALCTLGAQLALVAHDGDRYPIRLSVVLRLLVAPAVGLGLTWVLGLTGFVGQVLLISSCTPTALNVMLLCLQFNNQPDFAARAVFYSTLLSPVTVTVVIFLAQGGFFPHLALT